MRIFDRWKDFYTSLMKTESIKYIFSDISGAFSDTLNHAIYFLKNWRTIIKNLAKINIELGIEDLNSGQIKDAITRFKLHIFFSKYVNKIQPDSKVYYYFGRSYYQLFNFIKAKKYFELYIDTKNTEFSQEVEYNMKMLTESLEEVYEIPKSIISTNFNQLFSDKGYEEDTKPAEILVSMLNEILQAMGTPYANSVLDLGCGTGSIGEASRRSKLASKIAGVDLSRVGVKIASLKTVENVPAYSECYNIMAEDYIAHAINEKYKFNIIVAADLISYMADIASLFANIKNIMHYNSIFALSFKLTSSEDIEVEFDKYSEMYFFSFKCIDEIAKSEGFILITKREVTFMQDIPGIILLYGLNQNATKDEVKENEKTDI